MGSNCGGNPEHQASVEDPEESFEKICETQRQYALEQGCINDIEFLLLKDLSAAPMCSVNRKFTIYVFCSDQRFQFCEKVKKIPQTRCQADRQTALELGCITPKELLLLKDLNGVPVCVDEGKHFAAYLPCEDSE